MMREPRYRAGIKIDHRGCIVVGDIFPRSEPAEARTIHQIGNYAVRFAQVCFDAIDIFLLR